MEMDGTVLEEFGKLHARGKKKQRGWDCDRAATTGQNERSCGGQSSFYSAITLKRYKRSRCSVTMTMNAEASFIRSIEMRKVTTHELCLARASILDDKLKIMRFECTLSRRGEERSSRYFCASRGELGVFFYPRADVMDLLRSRSGLLQVRTGSILERQTRIVPCDYHFLSRADVRVSKKRFDVRLTSISSIRREVNQDRNHAKLIALP